MDKKIETAAESCTGKEQTENQDALLILNDEQVFVLCDGEGRRGSGKTASTITVETIRSCVEASTQNSSVEKEGGTNITREFRDSGWEEIIPAIQQANLEIYKSSKSNPKLSGMFTTIAAVYRTPVGMCFTNVGNSRIYTIRDNTIRQISKDHTLLNDYKKMNMVPPPNIGKTPKTNVIVRALGMKDSVKVDTFYEFPKPGDIYLLCTDGLWNYLDDVELLDTCLANSNNLQKACQEMTRLAVRNGSMDDISVILIHMP